MLLDVATEFYPHSLLRKHQEIINIPVAILKRRQAASLKLPRGGLIFLYKDDT